MSIAIFLMNLFFLLYGRSKDEESKLLKQTIVYRVHRQKMKMAKSDEIKESGLADMSCMDYYCEILQRTHNFLSIFHVYDQE